MRLYDRRTTDYNNIITRVAGVKDSGAKTTYFIGVIVSCIFSAMRDLKNMIGMHFTNNLKIAM